MRSGVVDKGIIRDLDNERTNERVHLWILYSVCTSHMYILILISIYDVHTDTPHIFSYGDHSVFGLRLSKYLPSLPTLGGCWVGVHTSAMYTRPFDPLQQVLCLGTVDLAFDAFDTFDAFGYSISSTDMYF